MLSPITTAVSLVVADSISIPPVRPKFSAWRRSPRIPCVEREVLLFTLVEKARAEKISHVFALTLAPVFFQKMGFRTVQHTDLPMKVWKDCIACPKYGNSDEIAMVLDLN